MAMVTGSSGAAPIIGMLVGMLLLGFAGILVGRDVAEKTTGNFLGRRLTFGYAEPHFGYITTSRAPSSFDSSDSSSSGSSFESSKSLESGSLESSDWQEVWPKVTRALGGSVGWITLSLILQALFGFLYYRVVTEPIVSEGTLGMKGEGVQASMNSIIGCTNDKWVCLQTLCCPMVRIAHTNAVAGTCKFWDSLWCWCCCAWLTMNLGPRCLLVWWRVQLKSVLKLDDAPLEDFCITLICPELSICQVSNAVDNAAGYEITGCCEYRPTSYAYE